MDAKTGRSGRWWCQQKPFFPHFFKTCVPSFLSNLHSFWLFQPFQQITQVFFFLWAARQRYPADRLFGKATFLFSYINNSQNNRQPSNTETKMLRALSVSYRSSNFQCKFTKFQLRSDQFNECNLPMGVRLARSKSKLSWFQLLVRLWNKRHQPIVCRKTVINILLNPWSRRL